MVPNMDFFLSFSHTTYMLLGLLLLYVSIRKKATKTKTSGKMGLPEPTRTWPVIGHLHLLFGQDPVCKKLGAMADKYGPIYSLKLGTNRLVVVSSCEIAKECFTINDKILATRPSIAAGKYMGYNNAVLALAPYGDYWRNIRKMATVELLSSYRLEKLKYVRFTEVALFVKDLHALCNGYGGGMVDMSELLEGLTFNLILRMIVGKRFSANTCREDDILAAGYKRAIKEAIYLSGKFVLSDAVPWLEWMDFKDVRRMKKTAKELDFCLSNWLEEHVRERKEGKQQQQQREEDESDFMDVMLLNLPEDDDVVSGHPRDVVVKATALILTLTGGESTSLTITWALSLLLNHPSILKKAQEELDTVVGKERWVHESDIKNLHLLQAIIKETLRLYPPGPVTGLREALEDCQISGYYVPKGTRVIINIWKLQRDPRNWENPDEFRPERFLATNAAAGMDFRGTDFEYIPFSSGRRSCPGMTFGLQVVQLTLARLLQGFDMAAPPGRAVDMEEGLGLALPKVSPLEMMLKPRLPYKCYQQL